LALLLGAWWMPALFCTVPLIALWGWWVWTRIGGISGDSHGAGIELLESGLLFSTLALVRIA
jgi:adenosylcobinamide-GDP ribazoletransferase